MEMFWIILGLVLSVVTGVVAYVVGKCDGELKQSQKRLQDSQRDFYLESKIVSTIKKIQYQEKIAKLEKQKRRR